MKPQGKYYTEVIEKTGMHIEVDLPIAWWASELTSKEVLSLPFYPETTLEEIGKMAEAIRRFAGPWQDKQEERF